MERQGLALFKYRGQMPVLLFILAVPFIWLTDYSVFPQGLPMVLSMVSAAISLAGFFIRAVTIGTTPKGTSGRNRNEQVAESLNTSGIYSRVRHPLYLGNYLMWTGISCYTFNPAFVLTETLLFWIYYERIMFAEECYLHRQFGRSFEEWAAKVPAIIPSFRNTSAAEVPFSLKAVLRREYSGLFATVFGFVFVDVLRDFFSMEKFSLRYEYLYCLGSVALVTFLLRTLKHHTSLLAESDRD